MAVLPGVVYDQQDAVSDEEGVGDMKDLEIELDLATHARDIEEQMLALCVGAAKGKIDSFSSPGAQREANVLRIAAMILPHRFPEETERIWKVVDSWFDQHPDDLLEAGEVVRRGWLISLPRFRDALELALERAKT
ncbi:MAG: hypothetical protein Q4B17_01285 [Lautropia sp.]|nr:hypothetical protein [Lautropia sp.]